MADWHEILNELDSERQKYFELANTTVDRVRRKYLKQLANLTGRNTIAYYSGFLTKPGVEGIDINDDDINAFTAWTELRALILSYTRQAARSRPRRH